MDKRSNRYKAIQSAKKKNKKFAKASKARKRIMIAEDVIAQLNAKNITLESDNCYMDSQDDISTKGLDGLKTKDGYCDVQLQDLLPAMGACNVCALGGVFYSVIAIDNKFKLNTRVYVDGEIDVELGSGEMRTRLKKVFTPYQMGLIETAFEGSCYMHSHDIKVNDLSARKQGEWYRAIGLRDSIGGGGDDKTMRIIMKNIIENEGTFKP